MLSTIVLNLLLFSQCSSGSCYFPNDEKYQLNFGIDDRYLYRNTELQKDRVTITLIPSPRTFKVYLITNNGEEKIDYSVEQFTTPPLDRNKTYYYTFRAVWPEGIDYIKKVEFRGDAKNVVVNLDYADAYIATYKKIGEKIFNFDKVCEWVDKNGVLEKTNNENTVSVTKNKSFESVQHEEDKVNENEHQVMSSVENNRVLNTESKDEEILNFGIDPGFIEQLKTNTFSSDSEKIRELENQLLDDSNKLRFTIIGKKEDRQKVINDLNTYFRDILQDLVIKEYLPEDWEVARFGFKTTGAPTIYIQQPDGKVLHRQDTYSGHEDLKIVFSKIRVRDPNYDPSKDPDLRKFGLVNLTDLVEKVFSSIRVNSGLITAVGVLLLLFSLLKNKRN